MTSIYRPLPAGQVRLIKIESIETKIKCTLEVHDIATIKATYFALSYEWGPEPQDQDRETILLNENDFYIWPTLAAALREVYNILENPNTKLVWTDFICLDQKNKAEKEIQVPLMKDVYINAKKVLGYLGPNKNEIDQAMACIRQSVWKWQDIGSPETPQSLEAIGVPPITDGIWVAFRGLFARGYFRRVWIWQEAVLAKDLLFLCGGIFLTWEEIHQFISVVTALGRHGHLNDHARVTARDSPLFALSMLQRHRERYHADSFLREPLPALLQFFRFLQVSQPVDRIWGSLALWHPATRQDVVTLVGVNYTDDYSLTYRRLARYYIPLDPTLLFLSVANSIKKNERLPSWCPDWNSRMAYDNFGGTQWFNAGYNTGDQRRSLIQLGVNDNTINVPGTLVDVVEEVADGEFFYSNIMEEIPDAAKKLLAWENRCLKLSQRAYHADESVPPQHWRTLVTDCLDKRTVHLKEDLLEDYNRFKALFSARANGNLTPIFKGDVLAAVDRFTMALEAACRGRKFFITQGGRVGVGPPDIEAGDCVVAFDSAGSLFILRKLIVRSEAFSLVGDAYVCDLMTRLQVEEHRLRAHETFILE